MKKRFPKAIEMYRLRDYAILKDEDELYEYVTWEKGKQSDSPIWMSGKAVILGDILVLTKLLEEGEETVFENMKAVRKALKKLPDWFEKTKYFCVVLQQYASTPCLCTSGQPIDVEGQEYKRLQDALRRFQVVLKPAEGDEKKGVERAMANATDPF